MVLLSFCRSRRTTTIKREVAPTVSVAGSRRGRIFGFPVRAIRGRGSRLNKPERDFRPFLVVSGQHLFPGEKETLGDHPLVPREVEDVVLPSFTRRTGLVRTPVSAGSSDDPSKRVRGDQVRVFTVVPRTVIAVSRKLVRKIGLTRTALIGTIREEVSLAT